MKKIIFGFLLLMSVISGCNTTIKECYSDNDCPNGYVCYSETDCGLGPNGAVKCPLNTRLSWDNLCHKRCQTDEDCSSDMSNCKTIIISDYGENLCFS